MYVCVCVCVCVRVYSLINNSLELLDSLDSNSGSFFPADIFLPKVVWLYLSNEV